MTQLNVFEDYPWNDFGKQVHHLVIQDLRRRIFLATEGNNAIADKTLFQAPPTVDDVRFAQAWKDIFYNDYPADDVVYDNTGDSPTEYEGAVRYPQVRPGSVTCYFERSFSHAVLAAIKTNDDYEFKFAATQISKYGIYNENGSTVDVNGTQETWYEEEDDFRPGTPFVIQAGGADDPTNDGFYRVRSVRNDGNYVYVIADDNNYQQQELKEVTYSSTNAVCNFGGDWYTLLGQNGNCLDSHMRSGGRMEDYLKDYGDYTYLGSIRERWWSTKDIAYHRYEKTGGEVTYGPHDGRPPTGGQMSKDFNADWVRCVNPNLYHTYDRNAHRWHVEAETDGSISGGDYAQYTALIPSWKFMCFQADPKEGTQAPFFFKDTNRLHWKYGKKIKIQADKITNPASLGPVQAVRSTGYWTQQSGYVATGTDHQYNSTYTREISGGLYCEDGTLPVMTGQHYLSKWINVKYDDALQNMIEHACSDHDWMLEVDDDYKYNWLWVHKYSTINGTLQDWLEYSHGLGDGELDDSTYWDIYQTYGLDEAYNPDYNPAQPKFAYLTDEYWGENGSAFELILKLLGPDYYDWYLDETYPYRCKRILDAGWEWAAALDEDDYEWPVTFNGIQCNSINDIKEACWQVPVAVWRRTLKHGFGRLRPCKMRDGSRGDPGNFPTAAAGGDWPYEFNHPEGGTDNIRMIGRVVMEGDEPDDDVFYNWQETAWSVPDPAKPNRIRLAGNKTGRFKSGNIVWANISDSYDWYYVLKVETDATYTYVTLSDEFASDGPTHLRGDENLSLHHDPEFVVNDVPQYGLSRLPTILEHSRDVLNKLEYKALDITVSYVYEAQTSYPYGEWFESREALLNRYITDIWGNWDDDVENWDPFSIGGGGGQFGVSAGYYYDDEYGWRMGISISNTVTQFAAKITVPVFFDKEAVTFIHALKFRGRTVYEPSRTEYLGIEGFGIYELPQWDDDANEYPPYKIIYLPIRAESDTVQYVRIKILGELDDWMLYGTAGGDKSYATDLTASCLAAELTAGSEFLVRFDWDKFGDAIFERTHERADYKLLDPFAPDTNPPVQDNEWTQAPTLYDANFPEFSYDDSYQYDKETHVPDYRIKAESVLMEDLEGNGVEYIFDFEHEIYADEADYFDTVQTSRKYDKTLEDNTSGWDTRDAAIDEWEGILNSKDNVSGSVPGAADNVGTPTAAVGIVLDENLPMFPVMPRMHSEKIQVDGTWYDHIWTDVPWCDEALEYRLEVLDGSDWDVLYDFGTANPDPPTGGNGGDNHFYVSGAAVTETSNATYRLRYQNSDTQKPGMYSEQVNPL